MIFSGEKDPFILSYRSVDESWTWGWSPVPASMQGWELLEDMGLVTSPSFGRAEGDKPFVWPVHIGLGLGVKIAHDLLKTNHPERRTLTYLQFAYGLAEGETAAHRAGHSIAKMAQGDPSTIGAAIDPNLERLLRRDTLDKLNFADPAMDALFMASFVYGHTMVRVASDEWEFDHYDILVGGDS